jgi:hypothetical protein
MACCSSHLGVDAALGRKRVDEAAGDLGQAVLFHQGQDGDLDGREAGVEPCSTSSLLGLALGVGNLIFPVVGIVQIREQTPRVAPAAGSMT